MRTGRSPPSGSWSGSGASRRANLRRVLAPAAEALGRQLIVTQRPGYLVALEPDELDLLRFERSLAAAAEAQRAGRLDDRIGHLRGALAEWRGDPLAGLPVEIDGLALTTRLNVERDGAVESLLEAEVEQGRHREVLGELEDELARQPLNERLRELHMLALYRSGRQADALASYREARERFLDELGLDPSPRLASLEARILDHDPSLQLPEPSARPGGALASDLDGPTVVRSSVLWIPARLVIEGRDVVLDRGVVTIGRAADRDVVLDDPSVSRRHAEIRQEGQTWRVVDVGSANGVVVNGVRTGAAALADGDQLRLGGVELTFRIGV
jgi:DNA-binding SARP family transcriptional activator